MDRQYDVIVVGGGAAGVAAAVGSSRAGAKTLLVESYGCLGGAATMKGVVELRPPASIGVTARMGRPR